MSDNYTNPDIDDDEDDEDSASDFKNLRAKARKAEKIERENLSLKRELAFTKAGIPMDDPRMSYFVKGYDGELDPTAIKSAATEAGFLQAQEAAPDLEAQQARQGMERVAAVSNGSEMEPSGASATYAMEQAYAEGGIQGLSDVSRQFGVTFEQEIL